MARKTVTLSLMAGVLLLALGGYIVLSRYNVAQSAAESAAAAGVQVATLSADEVTGISSQVQGITLELEKVDGIWQMADDPAFPLGQSYVTSMLAAVAPLSGQGPLQQAQEKSEYGLKSGCDTVTLTNGDGVGVTVLLGDTNSLTGSVYAMVEGSDEIYLTESTVRDPFTHTQDELIQMEEIPYMDEFVSLAVENAVGSWEYTFPQEEADSASSGTDGSKEASSASANAESSVSSSSTGAASDAGESQVNEQDPDAEKAQELADALTLLAWQQCVDWQGEKASYGLDDPAARVTAVYTQPQSASSGGGASASGEEEQEIFVLLIGAQTDDGSSYYAALEGSELVYTISADAAQLFLE